MLKPIELVHAEVIAAGTDNPFFEDAVGFQNSCQEMWRAPIGRQFFRYLASHAHPCKHLPQSDPIIAAHAAGRAEMVAFMVLTACPDDVPNLSRVPTLTEHPNEHR